MKDRRLKTKEWIGICIHHTGIGDRQIDNVSQQKWKQLLSGISSWLTTDDEHYVSAHYIIGREGEGRMLVNDDYYVSYHAGRSSYWHPIKRKWLKGMNEYMIGIELVGDGNKGKYTIEQYMTLADICFILMKKHKHITAQCIVGHEVISPGRKPDPGVHFNWNLFYKLLFKR